MNEFNPNCGRCGMLNSRGFCSLTACRYPSNVIVVEPTVIRGMMANPQVELPEEFKRRMAENKQKSLERCARVKKPQSNADRIRAMTDEELADRIMGFVRCEACEREFHIECNPLMTCRGVWLEWLKRPVMDKEMKPDGV